jgi:hypothetical protein
MAFSSSLAPYRGGPPIVFIFFINDLSIPFNDPLGPLDPRIKKIQTYIIVQDAVIRNNQTIEQIIVPMDFKKYN